jgi:hypothetical protein
MKPTEQTARLTVDAKGVAMMLGLEFENQFLTRRRRLEKRGFPRPLPMTPLRWSIAAIEAWVRASGAANAYPVSLAELAGEKRHPAIVRLEAWRAA